jgi:Fe2+ or Zn2+ uptake regulation protein
MNLQEKLEQTLHSYNLRLTRPRRIVMEFFSIAQEPIQLPQIIKALDQLIDRASIYRTINLFLKIGLIKEVHRPGKQWLELGERFSPHHHHVTCSRCGYTLAIHSIALEKTLTLQAKHVGFQALGHHLEITGLCRSCLKDASGNQEIIK